MGDDFPVGTIAGQGREVQPFRGTLAQIPAGWVVPVGQTLLPDQHDHPTRKGPWTLPDLSRQIITGASTHIESVMGDDGRVAGVRAANQDVPGIYPLVKVRKN